MRRSTTFLIVMVFAIALTGAMTIDGLIVSAQNSNSNATMQPNTNANANSNRRTGKRRGTRRRTAAAETAETGATAAVTPKPTGRCDPSQQEQTDLSGTYTGKVKHGSEAWMDATLTVTGNNFTIASGSDTHSGRITAVTTCGYTAVTVMMGDMTPPAATAAPPAPNMAMSLRAKKVGNSLTLTSVPGEPQQVMFTTGGGAMRPRKHRTKKPVAPPPPTKTTP